MSEIGLSIKQLVDEGWDYTKISKHMGILINQIEGILATEYMINVKPPKEKKKVVRRNKEEMAKARGIEVIDTVRVKSSYMNKANAIYKKIKVR